MSEPIEISDDEHIEDVSADAAACPAGKSQQRNPPRPGPRRQVPAAGGTLAGKRPRMSEPIVISDDEHDGEDIVEVSRAAADFPAGKSQQRKPPRSGPMRQGPAAGGTLAGKPPSDTSCSALLEPPCSNCLFCAACSQKKSFTLTSYALADTESFAEMVTLIRFPLSKQASESMKT